MNSALLYVNLTLLELSRAVIVLKQLATHETNLDYCCWPQMPAVTPPPPQVSFIQGLSALRSKPLPLLYTIWTETVPISCTFHRK